MLGMEEGERKEGGTEGGKGLLRNTKSSTFSMILLKSG